MRMKEIIKAQLSLEAATRGALQEMVFLEISQNSQENTCDSLFCEICEISKNTFLQNMSGLLLLSHEF